VYFCILLTYLCSFNFVWPVILSLAGPASSSSDKDPEAAVAETNIALTTKVEGFTDPVETGVVIELKKDDPRSRT